MSTILIHDDNFSKDLRWFHDLYTCRILLRPIITAVLLKHLPRYQLQREAEVRFEKVESSVTTTAFARTASMQPARDRVGSTRDALV